MPADLRAYRIFLSSPSGLDAERAAFFSAVDEINEFEGEQRDRVFIAHGWERETSGIRRPMARLGDRLRKCDYLVLILADRWGSPTGPDGTGFSSGTEEEYEIAWKCLGGEEPMRDIAVLFKGINELQMADPGPQLRKVLDFKARLEKEKGLLYGTFDSEAELGRILRAHLMRWLREDDDPSSLPSGGMGFPTVGFDEVEAEAQSGRDDSGESSPLEDARDLADRGRTAKAEGRFAQAVSEGSEDLEAQYHYARFLRHNDRLDHSIRVSERLIATAKAGGEVKWTLLGLGNLGVCQRRLGRVNQARATLVEGIALANGTPEHREALAYLENNLGLTCRRCGEIEQAERHYLRALHTYEELGDDEGRAHAHVNLSYVVREQGDLALAREHAEAVVGMGARNPNCLAMAHRNLGLIAEEEEDLAQAERCFEQALEINSDAGNVRGQGMNFAHLARVKLECEDEEGARLAGGHALALNERSWNTEGIAMSLHVIGQIEMHRSEYVVAESRLNDALDIYKALGHRVDLSIVLADLAVLLARTRRVADARSTLGSAKQRAVGVAHVKLQARLTRAEEEVEVAEREPQGAA